MANTVPSGDSFLNSFEPENEPDTTSSAPSLPSLEECINHLKQEKLTAGQSVSGSSSLSGLTTSRYRSSDPDPDDNEFLDPQLHFSTTSSSQGGSSASSLHISTTKRSMYQAHQANVSQYVHNYKQAMDALSACKRFKPNSQAKFEEFKANTDNPTAREVLLCTTILEMYDARETCNEEDSIPSDQPKEITMATLISPMLTAYRGDLLPAVLGVIRALSIDNIPDDRDTHTINIIAERIRHFVTEGQNVIKSKIAASLKAPSTVTGKQDEVPLHITDLSCNKAWALNGDIKIMAPLQVRITFLHAVLAEGQFTDYWNAVDNRQVGDGLRQSALRVDQQDYLHPLSSKLVQHPTCASSDVPKWQCTCERFAGQAETCKGSRKSKKNWH
ncbi:hypothetical protein K439DRAFT_1620436 [Ramaria rubella]|nr:hypothetical protein K439DRAFT_1620436 [Ramaria rubella]